MAFAAGALTVVSTTSTTASLTSAAATGGTGPYTYQWYRSTTSGFSPGAGNIITGATSLSLNDSGLIPSTKYYYEVVATDTGNGNATADSSQALASTLAASLAQNSFSQGPVLGMVDLAQNWETISAQVDSSQSGSLLAGQAVKIVASAGGVPKVVGCSADSDAVFGFINYDIKSQSFSAGDRVEISQAGNVMYLYATGAINRGSQVTLDITTVGGVAQKVTSSGSNIVGYALDQPSSGQLFRVKLGVPSFQTA